MSTATEIARLIAARNTIRDKLISMGISGSTDKLDVLAEDINNIIDRGAVSATVSEGQTYTIPAGYHNGSGTVSGIGGGGDYDLQSKVVTPTKSQQSITPDTGYYGLSDVTVMPIPDAYQNVSDVTAVAGDVLANKVIVTSEGPVTGTMANNGAVSIVLDATAGKQSYSIPAGYHNGNGNVQIVLEQKTAIPSEITQSITPSNGKVLGLVTINPIPEQYGDTTGDNAIASNILAGVKAHTIVNGVATQITGSMSDNGQISASIDGITTTSYSIPDGYTSGGTVSLDNTIETALAAI